MSQLFKEERGNRDTEQEKRPTQTKGRIYLILAVFFAVVFVVCAVILVTRAINRKNAERRLEELAKNTVSVISKTEPEQSSSGQEAVSASTDKSGADTSAADISAVLEEMSEVTEAEMNVPEEPVFDPDAILLERGITIPEKALDWEELYKVNEDIYAWIYIPETLVDFPILQDPDELNYYLNHNLDHSKGFPACIYTQYYNSKDFTDGNTVIYGHNSKNGNMFGSLHRYEDSSYIEKSPYIYIYTPEHTFVYEIYMVAAFNNKLILANYDFSKPEETVKFLNDVAEFRDPVKLINFGLEPTGSERFVTLSTCIKDVPEKRFLVVGVLLNDPFEKR